MIKISEKRRNRIFEEAKYFGKYDHVFSENEWTQYYEFLSEPGKIENLIEAMNSFYLLKLVIQYLYSHIDNEGALITLHDCAKFDKYVKKYYSYFKRVERDYIYILIERNIPLFFIDVDNTLTVDGFLSKERIDFIKNYKYKDRIILSTGKSSSAIKDVLKECGLESNYCSCINGSVIYKDGKNELISKLGKISEAIINDLKKTNIKFIGYYEDGVKKIIDLDEAYFKDLEKYNEKCSIEKTLDYNKIIKILCFIKDDSSEEEKEKEEKVKQIVESYEDINCVRTSFYFYEILTRKQHKGNGVRKIAEKLNTYYRISVGIGDSMNDYPLLTHTGKSYIVSTSSAELKSHGFEELGKNRNTDILEVLKKYENRETI